MKNVLEIAKRVLDDPKAWGSTDVQPLAKALMEIVEAAKPIIDWRVKLAVWDGGCARPSEPKSWQWHRLKDAVEGKPSDQRLYPTMKGALARIGDLEQQLEAAKTALGLLSRNGDEWSRHQVVGVATDALANIRS